MSLLVNRHARRVSTLYIFRMPPDFCANAGAAQRLHEPYKRRCNRISFASLLSSSLGNSDAPSFIGPVRQALRRGAAAAEFITLQAGMLCTRICAD